VILPNAKGSIYLADTLENDPLTIEIRQRLTYAIRNLPDRERLVFTLCYYEKLTNAEVGLLLDETESYVSRIHASALSHLDVGFDGPGNYRCDTPIG
jgi:RNA polymerase sigma factor for flagellar operon FliA